MMPLLLLCLCSLSDPNGLADANDLRGLAAHWLAPGRPAGQLFKYEGIPPHRWTYLQTNGLFVVIKSESTSNISVTGGLFYPVNMADLAAFSKRWKGDPNYVPPPEPNLPPDPCEPNLAEMLEGVTDPNMINLIKNLMGEPNELTGTITANH